MRKVSFLENGNAKITIPITLKTVAGRKRMIEENADFQPQDDSMVQSIVRAFRWQALIDSGEFANAHALSVTIGLGETYIARVLRLTLLSPEIIHHALAGTLPSGVSLSRLHKLPINWEEQKEQLGI